MLLCRYVVSVNQTLHVRKAARNLYSVESALSSFKQNVDFKSKIGATK